MLSDLCRWSGSDRNENHLSTDITLLILASTVAHMDPLHATIEEFAAEGYTHIECFCPRCRFIRLMTSAGGEVASTAR